VTLAEIARLDDMQLAWVYFRKRDKYGRLVRKKRLYGKLVKRVNRSPLRWDQMFKETWRKRGKSEAEIEQKYRQYLADNPSLKDYLSNT
jgi:hypothetical protein